MQYKTYSLARLAFYFLFIFIFIANTTVTAADPVSFHQAGPFKIRAELDPKIPKIGKNKVTIWVQGEDGKPLNNVTLKAVAIMPAMGSMPTMYAPAEISEIKPGQYEGIFQPSMGGEWPLTIEIKNETEKGSITFDLATGRKGLRCTSCGGLHADVPGTVRVDPNRRQLIGITTGKVKQKKLRVTIRAAGRVTYDETRLSDVALKFDGWIGKLYANAIGKSVKKGEPLFTVYSPELLNAQEEYLETLKSKTTGKMREAAHRRLSLWGISKTQIIMLKKRGKAHEYMPILASANGVVLNKRIVAGSAFKAGQQLLRIADLSKVWVEAQIYDYELPLIKTGMKAKVILPELQDREYPSKVDFIYPFMDNDTRTVRVRVVLKNNDGFLRPEMYAHIHLKAKLGKRLVVPESAVLYSGRKRIVFLDLGDGSLVPRKIKTGQRNRKWIEVLEGLKAGDTVVTSGNFLIAAESKLKAGLESW